MPSDSPEPDGEDSTDEDPGGSPGSEVQPGEVPLEWTVRSHVWQEGCSHRYLVDREPEQVPPAPAVQDAESWASEAGAVHGGLAIVETTLRAAEDAPVVIDALHIRMDGQEEPLPWNEYTTGAGFGGALSEARFEVDLDSEQPLPVPVDGYDAETDEALPAPHLPYQITADDPLLLRVDAETAECDCTWWLEIEWSSGHKRGTAVIDDGGEPFRNSAASGGDSYMPVGDGWTEESD